MSPKRLLWTGLTCLVLSAVTVGIGFFAQALLIVFAIVLFQITIQVPLSAAHSGVGETYLTVPHVWPVVLAVAWLFLAIALGCLFESGRRLLARRPPY
jgi:hypothetical protein